MKAAVKFYDSHQVQHNSNTMWLLQLISYTQISDKYLQCIASCKNISEMKWQIYSKMKILPSITHASSCSKLVRLCSFKKHKRGNSVCLLSSKFLIFRKKIIQVCNDMTVTELTFLSELSPFNELCTVTTILSQIQQKWRKSSRVCLLALVTPLISKYCSGFLSCLLCFFYSAFRRFAFVWILE